MNKDSVVLDVCQTLSFEDEIKQLHQSGYLDHVDFSDFGDMPEVQGTEGIEAHDVGSLLEQFEEVSQNLGDCDSLQPSFILDLNQNHTAVEQGDADSTVGGPEKAPTLEVVNKVKAAVKRKSAIMLPMGLPSKRGRGRAQPLPANSTPLKLQRIMMQTPGLRDLLQPLQTDEIQQLASQQKRLPTSGSINDDSNKENNSFTVNDDYFNLISDHDYCQNSPKVVQECYSEKASLDTLMPESGYNSENSGESFESCEGSDAQKLTDEKFPDTVMTIDNGVQTWSAEDSNHDSFSSKTENSRKETFSSGLLKKPSIGNRNYRKKEESLPPDSDKYFDKIPSYMTTLSIPSKVPQKDGKINNTRAGISVHDYIDRDMSPSRDPSLYDKLPAYYSCFTNSTKYDGSESKLPSEEARGETAPAKYPQSGNSNQNKVRALLETRKRSSKSRSRSESCSSSSSSSSSSSGSRSRSRCSSYSRSRSRDRRRRKMRRRSYSSSSSKSRSSTSRSRSRSRSRTVFSSRSRSRSSSRRRWRRERLRSRSRVTRSRSRSRISRSRSPVRRSRSRLTRSRSRSRRYRSTSAEWRRRRIENKREREIEKKIQIEERRIIYVGRLPENFTRRQLRQRFQRFGPIEEVNVHFREHGDNYGFVTFSYTCDAYAALEKGNAIVGEPHFDLCFGGRRQFCDTDYADLDGIAEMQEEFHPPEPNQNAIDFDELLRQARLNQRK